MAKVIRFGYLRLNSKSGYYQTFQQHMVAAILSLITYSTNVLIIKYLAQFYFEIWNFIRIFAVEYITYSFLVN